MRSRRALLHGSIVALAALAASALLSDNGSARSRSSHLGDAGRAPLRAVVFLTAPVRLSALAGRPAPRTARDDAAAVKRHLAALDWARADAAIVPWLPPGSAADRKFAAVLAAIESTRSHVRAAALLDRPHGNEASQIQALAMSRAAAPGYLHIGSRPVVFVAQADRSLRDCVSARRWRVAARGFWLAQATFPGHLRCRSAANTWFRDEPDARNARASGSFLIRPGFWPSGSAAPTLRRSPAAWQRSI